MLPVSRSWIFAVLVGCCLTLVAHAQQPPEPLAASQFPPQSQVQETRAQPTPTQQTPAKTQATQASDQQEAPPIVPVQYARMLLVVFVLLVLAYLFWAMILYSNRIAQTGPLGIQITDALDEVRKRRVLKALDEKWEAREYYRELLSDEAWMSEHAVPAVPDELKGEWASREARHQLLQRGRIGTLPPEFGDESETQQTKKVRREYLETLRAVEATYDAEARRRRAEEQRTLTAPPKGTEKGVLRYFDFPSVAGQGPEFVLRFTALVTIIFAVIALSILGLLNPDQAGTILAAIAGYVLGQASARTGRGGAEEAAQTEKAGKGGP